MTSHSTRHRSAAADPAHARAAGEPDAAPPAATYRARAERFTCERGEHASRARRLSHLRLLVVVAIVVVIALAARFAVPRGAEAAIIVALAAVFVVLVGRHGRARDRERRAAALARVNEESGHRLARRWGELPPPPVIAVPETHPFARDLHLFGRMSLSQLLGSAGTPIGRATVARWLLEPAAPEEIPRRQDAVRELAVLVDFRDELAARARMSGRVGEAELERFLRVAEGTPWLRRHPALRWTSRVLAAVTIALTVGAVAGAVSWLPWMLAIGVNIVFGAIAGGRARALLGDAFARESPVRHYVPIFALLERTRFQAPLLRERREGLGTGDAAADAEVRRLGGIADLAHVRWSPMLYMTLQGLLLWDFHVLDALERWQARAGGRMRAWIGAMAEIEALCAMGALAHAHPHWSFPQTGAPGPPVLAATGLGHPLLPDEERVVNDVTVGPPGTFLLVTGSNMSGKSTLLRAIGTNVVLAQCGAPVCAASLRLPPLAVESSMVVPDSLEQGLSRFMAELTRLKGVVEASRRVRAEGDRTLLYLLDEMLGGTNSDERQVAARRIIGHLLAQGAIGAVTTHDLALAEAEPLRQAAVAVHFQEHVGDGVREPAMSFDYRLRDGVATSVNALRLMALVGLD